MAQRGRRFFKWLDFRSRGNEITVGLRADAAPALGHLCYIFPFCSVASHCATVVRLVAWAMALGKSPSPLDGWTNQNLVALSHWYWPHPGPSQ